MDKIPTLNSFNKVAAASSALLTYERYYGLREKPFSAAHSATFEDLFLAIRRREGLIVLTGDIGNGAPPRVSAPNGPVPIPEGVAQSSAMSGRPVFQTDTAPSARR